MLICYHLLLIGHIQMFYLTGLIFILNLGEKYIKYISETFICESYVELHILLQK